MQSTTDRRQMILASFLSTRLKKKSTAIAVLFFLEMKRTCGA